MHSDTQEMLEIIRKTFPTFRRVEDAPNDTSKGWKVPGFLGQVGGFWSDGEMIVQIQVGFITSMSEQFCGSCNRLRLTADGNLKVWSTVCFYPKHIKTNQVCLFGNAEVSLRDAIRQTSDDSELKEVRLNCHNVTTIGLQLIEAAVKRKKPRHAGVSSIF